LPQAKQKTKYADYLQKKAGNSEFPGNTSRNACTPQKQKREICTQKQPAIAKAQIG
jgi:hypothetical protein